MSFRSILVWLLLFLLARSSLGIAAPVMFPVTPVASDFDEEDFPGVIVFHVHSDGRLHIHIHLAGTHSFFVPWPTLESPPVVHLPALPAGTPTLLASAAQNLTTLVGWLITSTGLVALFTWGPRWTTLFGGRPILLVPPDPPPRPIPAEAW